MSVTEIIRGWSAWVLGGNAVRIQIKQRMAICHTCPNRKTLSVWGQPVDDDLHGVYYCKLCTCPLEIKTADPRASCPDKPPRWGPNTLNQLQ